MDEDLTSLLDDLEQLEQARLLASQAVATVSSAAINAETEATDSKPTEGVTIYHTFSDKDQTVEIVDKIQRMISSKSFVLNLNGSEQIVTLSSYGENTIRLFAFDFDKSPLILFYNTKSKDFKSISIATKTLTTLHRENLFDEAYDAFYRNTIQSINDVMGLYCFEDEWSLDFYKARPQLSMRFKDFEITNKVSKIHTISDMIYILHMVPNKCATIYAARPSLTRIEFDRGYIHSHATGSFGRANCCLGRGITVGLMSDFNSNYWTNNYDANVTLISKLYGALFSMKSFEDLDGGPYRRIESLKASSSNGDSFIVTQSLFDSNIREYYGSIVTNAINSIKDGELKPTIIQNDKKGFNITIPFVKFKEWMDSNRSLYPEALKVFDANDLLKINLTINGSTVNLDTAFIWKGSFINKINIIGDSKLEKSADFSRTFLKYVHYGVNLTLNNIVNNECNNCA
jgi:hypothetical protein